MQKHISPEGLTNTDNTGSIVKVNPDNENHKHGFFS